MISSLILLFGTCSFAVSLLIHILVWRIIRPIRHLTWLGVIFIIAPLLLYIILFLYKHSIPLFDIIFIVLWHLTLSCAYILSYPLMQAECPSLKIILDVSASMPEGMTAESINNLFSQDTLLNDRIEDLINDRLIILKNGELELSFKGRLLSIFFSTYRSLLGLPLGAG